MTRIFCKNKRDIGMARHTPSLSQIADNTWWQMFFLLLGYCGQLQFICCATVSYAWVDSRYSHSSSMPRTPTTSLCLCEVIQNKYSKSRFQSPAVLLIHHPTASLVASVAKNTSWCRPCNVALDCGVQGTHGLKSLLKELSNLGRLWM